MADRGVRVLIVDGDPQCNLTGTVLGFQGTSDFSEFYFNHPRANLSSCLEPVFQGSSRPLSPAVVTKTINPNLLLLAGSIDLAENETQLSVALTTSSAIPALQNMPGSICHLLRLTAKEHNIDVVIVDMSPSVGALNQCFLMGSNFFIVPTSPDYYCKQAISSLSRVIPRWHLGVAHFRNSSLQYSLPSTPPKFCGIISQRYRPRTGSPARAFQHWTNVIKETVTTELVPALDRNGMCVSASEFMAATPSDTPFNLINISDFNSLIAKSHQHSTPVFALSDEQIDQQGEVLTTMKRSRDEFRKSFATLAHTVEMLTGVTSTDADGQSRLL